MIPKHQDACAFDVAVLRCVLICGLAFAALAAPAVAGITAPARLAGAPGVESVGIDGAGRTYAAGGGRATVLSPDGALLAAWSVPESVRAAVLPGGGIVTAAWMQHELTRWAPDGAVVSRWTMPGPVLSLAADPSGSLLVRDDSRFLKRVALDGAFIGRSPFPAGDPALAPDGTAWIVNVSGVAGYTSDGLLLTTVGRECPIGGNEPPCNAGPFSGSGLHAAATADGGLLVADAGVLHGFTPSGGASFTCSLGGTPITGLAVRDRTVVLARADGVYTATLSDSSPICRAARVRVDGLRVRGRTLAFSLTRRARVHVLLYRVRSLDCGARGIVSTAGCSALGRLRTVRAGTFARGANAVSLPRMEAGRWLVTVRAGDTAVANLRFATTRLAPAAGRSSARDGGRARGR